MKKTIFSLLSLLAISSVMQAQTISVAGDVEALASGETVSFNLHIADVTAMTSMHFEVELPSGFIVSSVSATSEWPAMFSREGGVIGAISSSDNALTGEGDIATVQIEVPANTETGVYPITVDHVRVNGTELETTAQFNVVVVNAHTVILDETSTTAPEAATNVDVIVKRTIKANQWSTICLPFAMSEAQINTAFGDGVELADFDSYEYDETEDVISVKFTDVTAMEANHPYIIKVSQAIEEFAVDGVDVEPTAEPFKGYYTTGKKPKLIGKFAGTYVADFDFYDAADNYPLFLSGNKFYYATENTMHMKAFRGYFDFEDNISDVENASARIQMVLDESETTGISGVKHESNDDRYYNLNGQRVEHVKKGLYIKNNKKVVVK